jgi:hypothetical protein
VAAGIIALEPAFTTGAALGPTAQEIALRDTYFKMHLLLGSAVTMNRLEHFQSVAALTRSLFELHLDMTRAKQPTSRNAGFRHRLRPRVRLPSCS